MLFFKFCDFFDKIILFEAYYIRSDEFFEFSFQSKNSKFLVSAFKLLFSKSEMLIGLKNVVKLAKHVLSEINMPIGSRIFSSKIHFYDLLNVALHKKVVFWAFLDHHILLLLTVIDNISFTEAVAIRTFSKVVDNDSLGSELSLDGGVRTHVAVYDDVHKKFVVGGTELGVEFEAALALQLDDVSRPKVRKYGEGHKIA